MIYRYYLWLGVRICWPNEPDVYLWRYVSFASTIKLVAGDYLDGHEDADTETARTFGVQVKRVHWKCGTLESNSPLAVVLVEDTQISADGLPLSYADADTAIHDIARMLGGGVYDMRSDLDSDPKESEWSLDRAASDRITTVHHPDDEPSPQP